MDNMVYYESFVLISKKEQTNSHTETFSLEENSDF